MTERVREFRDWTNLVLTGLTVLVIPIGLLVLRDQRFLIMDEVRRSYVSQEAFTADHNARTAENAKLATDIIEINAKLSNIQITITRLSDATKLKDGP
jgi:hypothetical protein